MSSTYLCQYIILSVYLLLFNMCSCSMVCTNIPASIPDIGAVSYTHLDVYKRQPQTLRRQSKHNTTHSHFTFSVMLYNHEVIRNNKICITTYNDTMQGTCLWQDGHTRKQGTHVLMLNLTHLLTLILKWKYFLNFPLLWY